MKALVTLRVALGSLCLKRTAGFSLVGIRAPLHDATLSSTRIRVREPFFTPAMTVIHDGSDAISRRNMLERAGTISTAALCAGAVGEGQSLFELGLIYLPVYTCNSGGRLRVRWGTTFWNHVRKA